MGIDLDVMLIAYVEYDFVFKNLSKIKYLLHNGFNVMVNVGECDDEYTNVSRDTELSALIENITTLGQFEKEIEINKFHDKIRVYIKCSDMYTRAYTLLNQSAHYISCNSGGIGDNINSITKLTSSLNSVIEKFIKYCECSVDDISYDFCCNVS
jgi:hypothetical protein